MSSYDYYIGLKELDPAKVTDYERELYEAMQNDRYCLFFELMLIRRYRRRHTIRAETHAAYLEKEAAKTRETIEGAKVIPIQRAARKRVRKTVKIAQ